MIFVLVICFSFVITSAYSCVLFELCVNQLLLFLCNCVIIMYVMKCTVIFNVSSAK